MRLAELPNRPKSPRIMYGVEQIDVNGARIALRMISADQPATAVMVAAQKHFRALVVTPQDVADFIMAGGKIESALPADGAEGGEG